MNVDPYSSGDSGQSPTRSLSLSHRMRQLPVDFVPSDDDVICGRGKKCYSHVGNERFKARVHSVLSLYQSARTKLDKSKVLNMVVDQVRQNSPTGGFVKQDDTGRWHEVGDFLAREKTSQVFRDALHENYKSSSVSKKKRRQEELSKASDQLKVPRSTSDIARKIQSMSIDMKKSPQFSPESPRNQSLNDDIMTGIHRVTTASRDMRQDSAMHDINNMAMPSAAMAGGSSRISGMNVAGLQFEPDDYVSSPYQQGERNLQFARSPRRNLMETISETSLRNNFAHNVVGQRAASVPNVPPGSVDFYEDPYSQSSEDYHHSLPNIQFDQDEIAIEGNNRLYQSAPNLGNFSPSELLRQDHIPTRMYGSETKVPDIIQFPHRLQQGGSPHDLDRVERGGYLGQNYAWSGGTGVSSHPGDLLGHFENRRYLNEGRHSTPAAASAAAIAAESRGIVSSLENFARMQTEDDNPFEPIPINPNAVPSNQRNRSDEQERNSRTFRRRP